MNIIQTLTDRIIASLEAGKAPWHKTWQGGLPASLSTGREYRGINIFLLGTQEFSSRYWVTFREALRLGGHVRKGEKATPIVYWKWRTPEEIEKADREGRRMPPCYPFTSYVFNLDQVEGLARPETDVHHEPHRRLEIADLMLEMMPAKPEIHHALSNSPCYLPDFDRVLLPHLSQFTSAENYFAVLFHELIHATGHARRLNRFAKDTGSRSERYSFEELVAEFGAAFLCAFCGIRTAQVEELQASYIAGWAQVFRKDPMVLLRAASAAQKAADFIRGKVVQEAQDVEAVRHTESLGAVA
jgi:antirestriction protein ArdC